MPNVRPAKPALRRAPRTITSLQNDRVKAIRALEMRKTRRETGLFVAEGASLLVAAREHGFVPEIVVRQVGADTSVVSQRFFDWAAREGAECLEVSTAVLSKLVNKDNPQALLGVYRQRWNDLPDPACSGASDIWLALEEVRDPGNLGTIIRTAHAFSVQGLVLIGNCCDPHSRECVRATMGSIFSVPLVRARRDQFLDWRQGWQGDVAGTYLASSVDIRSVTFRCPVLLMMGSEGPGLTDALAKAATRLVRIPMLGDLDSLNLSVAAALALYEIRKPALKI